MLFICFTKIPFNPPFHLLRWCYIRNKTLTLLIVCFYIRFPTFPFLIQSNSDCLNVLSFQFCFQIGLLPPECPVNNCFRLVCPITYFVRDLLISGIFSSHNRETSRLFRFRQHHPHKMVRICHVGFFSFQGFCSFGY